MIRLFYLSKINDSTTAHVGFCIHMCYNSIHMCLEIGEEMRNLKDAIMVIDEQVRLHEQFYSLSTYCSPAKRAMSGGNMVDVLQKINEASEKFNAVMSEMRNADFVLGIDDFELHFPKTQASVPKKAGVYFLFSKITYTLDYIGKSDDLRRRPFYHHNHFDRNTHVVGYVLTPNPLALERELIKINLPRLNIAIPKTR